MGLKTKRYYEADAWWDGAYSVLEAVAVRTLNSIGDHSNMIEVGDLISEGYLYSVRYATNAGQKKWQALYLMKHMGRAYNRLQKRYRYTQKPTLQKQMPFETAEILTGRDDNTYKYFDLWQTLYDFCTPYERDLLLDRIAGMTLREIGNKHGLSRERIRQKIKVVRERLLEGTNYA